LSLRKFVVSLSCLFVAGLLAGADLPKGVTKVTSVEGITEYRLESNGLSILLFPDQSKSTATVNITYKVGSRNESYGETGMAHLLEHLMFKGSPKHPNVPQELTSHGARPNGTTWFDRTNYFETFDANDENLRWALDLESERMVHSFIAKKDLDSEMTVVRNEFESGENEPGQVLEERVLETAFIWHNYGHPTIGARADIENVPIERLQAFYRTFYEPDNAVLLVAGRFDEAKTLGWIVADFSGIPRPSRELPTFYTAEPTQDGERDVTLRRTGDVQELAMAYHIVNGGHPDAAAVEVLTQALTDSPSGRLYKALVEPGKASSVGGYMMELHDPGFAIFSAEIRTDKPIAAAEDAMREALDGVAKTPLSKEEVDRARNAILKDIDLTVNNSARIGLQMSESIGAGDWRLFFLDRDRVRKVTAEDVARVAGAYLKPSNRTVGRFLPTAKPDRAEIPSNPDVAAILKDYRGDAAVAVGETFDASPANIEARTKRTKLSGGMSLALLPKKTRGESVVASITLHFGDEKSLFGKSTAADLAAGMLERGTARHTRQEIRDAFDRLKARVAISGGGSRADASIETIRPNLPEVLSLVAEILREPSFPAKEFDELKQESLAELEQGLSDPQALATNGFRRALNNYPKGDVRYVESIDEEIASTKAASRDDVAAFQKSFYGASNAEMTVVGDFEPAEIAAAAEKLFGSWKSPLKFARVTDAFQDVAPTARAIETPDKANAMFLAGENLKIRDDDPDFAPLVLGNYILGGGFLNSRLASRIRQKEGLSYGVGSQLTANSLDVNGRFTAFAIFAPQNLERLEKAFQEEIARALKDGFTADEVNEARKGFLQSRQVSRAQDGELVRRLTNYLFIGRSFAWDTAFEERLKSLSPDELAAALRKHLNSAKLTVFKAGDFAGAKAKAAEQPKK
jgi:zinc protease